MLKNQLETLAVIVTSSGWLLYWTGRFYRESYFSVFQISYEMLGFDSWYYIYSSWVTIVVAISCTFLILNFSISIFAVFSSIKKKLILIMAMLGSFLLIMSAVTIIFTPITFSPFGSFVSKFICSKDIVIMCFILPSFSILAIQFYVLQEELFSFFHKTLNQFRPIVVLKIFYFSGIVSIIFLYLFSVAYLVGTFHASKAINEGKMGIKVALVNNKKWLYVVRTIDGRNFIYDRKLNIVKYVKDDEITELSPFDPNL